MILIIDVEAAVIYWPSAIIIPFYQGDVTEMYKCARVLWQCLVVVC